MNTLIDVELRRLTRAAIALSSAVALGLLPAASAQTAERAGNTTAQHDMSATHSADMKKSMESMSTQMATMSMTGDTDRDFALMMRIHHQGAIDMSQAQLAAGKDPEMRKLAKDIIAAQRKEIAQIDRWLRKYKSK